MSDRVRTTVSIAPEVLTIFRGMADAAGISVSRCLGDWLADTAEGAQLVAAKMQEARTAPIAVMREVQAMLRGTQEEAAKVLEDLRKSGRARPAAGAGGPPPERGAPSSNTGLKSPRKVKGRP